MLSEIKILMVDDDEEDFMIIRDIISSGVHRKYVMEWASSFKEGKQMINEKRHDVYLVDYRLGADSGLELIKEVNHDGRISPFILLTGQNNIETDEAALNAGVFDYLLKGTFSTQQLESSIRYSIEQAKNLEEIKMLNTDLEKRVAERTAVLLDTMNALENSKMELSNALEEERRLNELKSRFVSMVSHEFRTPLATSLSSLSLIAKYGETSEFDKQGKHISRIKSSIKHLTELLNDVLTVSQLEEGATKLSPVKFRIDEKVKGIVQEMQGITKNGQVINYQHSGDADVMLDKKIMRHILVNLISNAIKFSPEGKPVNISTSVEDGKITLSVQDHGVGIPEEDKKHLFERFFRASNVAVIQGTGLGLSIVAKQVELMNGKIDVVSSENAGTTFIVICEANQSWAE